MPLKDKTIRPSNIGEQIPPATPTAQNLPPIVPRESPGLANGALGPAPPDWTTTFDSVRQWVRPGTSQSRFPQLPVKSKPANNALASSAASQKVAPVQAQTNANTTAIAALQQTTFQGAWLATTSYSAGAQVDFAGKIYSSLLSGNLNNEPDISPTDWVQIGGTANYVGVWSSSTGYTTGQTVSDGSSLYIALQNSTNQDPTSTTGYWQLLSGSSTFYGAYSGSQAYPVGAEVSYNGSFWIAISATTGNTPAPGSSYWENVGTAAILLTAYSGSVTYSVGMQAVGTDGNVYSWINTTPGSGHAPPNSTYWQLVGPADLGSVADGTQRFAATASTLTYRPTSNPLTATDAGSNATVNIGSFTMQTSSKGAVSVNSGGVTALSYSTLYYIYYDDATLAGGSVTFHATTTKTTAINGSGRFFVGSIVTPAATAPDTTGNGDGGVGAQSGGTSIFLFGADAPTVTSPGTVSNASRAIDGSQTSFAALATNAGSGVSVAQLVLSAASPTSAPWSSLTLNVLSAVPINNFNGTDGTVIVQVTYSYQSGSGTVSGTLWSVGAGVTRALTTDTLSLPASVNLATLQITAKVSRSTGTHNCEIDLYECWITGIV
jgi:hypothetical protein